MALTRFLPTPSDRMGILWSLLQIKDAIILEYGTSGTTAYAMKTFGMMGMETNRVFTTGLDENAVVMGNTDKLEKKIIELDNKFAPKVIFVMASSVSSVIGSDIKGICNYIQNEVSAKIVVFTQGGFNGDYSSGIETCNTDLVSNFATNKYNVEECYNILGVSAMDNYSKNTVISIEKLLANHFNLTKNAVLFFETDLGKIETMSKSKINIVISYEGLKAAEILKTRFGTPYVYGFPIGKKATDEWLNKISKEINKEYNSDNIHTTRIESQNVVIYANYDVALSIRKYMEDMGCNIQDVICTHKIKNKDGIRYISNEKEKINLFKSLKNSIVYADSCFLNFVSNDNRKIDISNQGPIFANEIFER